MKRKREFNLLAPVRGGPFTNRSQTSDAWKWWYVVYATSLKQAFYLAKHEIFAADAQSVGVRTAETDWWHWLGSECGRSDPQTAEARGYRVLAPYLRGPA